MVEFNGVALEDVTPARVVDIAVASPEVQVTSQSQPLLDGARFIRRVRGVRTVAVSFVLMEEDPLRRRRQLEALIAWLSPAEPVPLRHTPEEKGHLMAVCTQYPDASSRQFWEVLTMVFTAFDPAYISCSPAIQPVTAPAMVVHGEPPRMRIEQDIAAPLASPRWTLGAEHLHLQGPVGVGKLVIDFDRQTVELSGQSILNQLTMDSRFFTLRRGANRITVEGGAGGTLTWWERWI